MYVFFSGKTGAVILLSKQKKSVCEIQQKTKEVMGFDVSMGIGKWVKKPEELIQSHDMAATDVTVSISAWRKPFYRHGRTTSGAGNCDLMRTCLN